MAYTAKKSSYNSGSSTSNRPSEGGSFKKEESSENSDFDTSTTHYLKNGKDFVDVVQIWENEGKFGHYLKVRVTDSLPAGEYYLSTKKDYVSNVTKK